MPIKKSIGILIQSIGEDWFTANMLCEIIGLPSKSSFIRNYIRPAIDEGLIALENPDKPNAPNQRYGLTIKGKALYYERHNHEDDVHNGAQSDVQNDVQNTDGDPQNRNDDPKSIERRIIEIIKAEPDIRRDRIAEKLNISRKTAERHMQKLGIAWLGHPKTGHWVFVAEI